MPSMHLITPEGVVSLIDDIIVNVSIKTSDGEYHPVQPHTIRKLSQSLCVCCGADGTGFEADDFFVIGGDQQIAAFENLRRFD